MRCAASRTCVGTVAAEPLATSSNHCKVFRVSCNIERGILFCERPCDSRCPSTETETRAAASSSLGKDQHR
eukprot:1751147-Amphidinium_carterae.1